ncbi:MAG TPA: hypothetical protein VFW71_03800 [Actinomycetota bacterium]|nr:hypothetical protein [Actinomycetota bacterium]
MEVQAECPWCGLVTVKPQQVRCAMDPEGEAALCQLECPVCHRLVWARTTAEGVVLILNSGGSAITGLVPFELLERRNGPPLLWDEILDLLSELESSACPQAELLGTRWAPRQTSQS